MILTRLVVGTMASAVFGLFAVEVMNRKKRGVLESALAQAKDAFSEFGGGFARGYRGELPADASSSEPVG